MAVGAAAALPTRASSQARYPSQPIRFIVGFAAGGASDLAARLSADFLSKELGQPIVVENIVGANAILAHNAVAKAAPDGYTLGQITSSFSFAEFLTKDIPYKWDRDFAHIGMMCNTQNVLVVSKTLGVKTVGELIALAKKKPGELDYVSVGIGSGPHMSMELFKLNTGTDISGVVYQQSGQARTDLISGRVDIWLSSMPSMLPLIAADQVVALAVAGSTRSPALPNLPTLAELGVPNTIATNYAGVSAPAGTPAAVIDTISSAWRRVAVKDEVKAAFEKIGAEVAQSSSKEFGDIIRTEIEVWSKVANTIGLKPQ